MSNIEKKLEVKDLTLSFRTGAGKVQAVRGISFDLYKGETLAIVGESGSGKSVTSRTILGISAKNAVIESGQIFYDGQDLLRISEEDFHAIRGDKIAMVFQDPLSSLNPIMKIGRQLTEAMLLKNKANRRECRKKLREGLRHLTECIAAADTDGFSAEDKRDVDTFKKIVHRQAGLEGPYTEACDNARVAVKAADDLLLEVEKEAVSEPTAKCRELKLAAAGAVDRYLVHADAPELKRLLGKLVEQAHDGARKGDYSALGKSVKRVREMIAAALEREKPDFLAFAYYMDFVGELPAGSVAELNALAADKLNSGIMARFIDRAETGVAYSRARAEKARSEAMARIDKLMPVFAGDSLEKAAAYRAAKELGQAVENAIDPLETVKDNATYTFRVSLESALDEYFAGAGKNGAEQRRFDRQNAKYQRLVARGKTPEWQVAPLSLYDEKRGRENIAGLISSIREHFAALNASAGAGPDARTGAVRLIAHLREMAAGEVHRVSRSLAKDQAIRIMESVGIPEARKRYSQYPFEFSGGMRQRIVIAISLTASPDVLICDEPTTALDVTIQAQILELINNIKRERNLSVIFITHDLGVVANMADRIAVMYAGKIVEYGTAADIFYSPAHPYTWALLSSVPDLDTSGRLESIPGTPPNMIYPPKGDAFAARNKYAMEIDFEQQPPMFQISPTHFAATWLLHPDAPHVEPPEIVRERIARMTAQGGNTNG